MSPHETGPGAVVAPEARIGRNVALGANVVIHPTAVIGDDCEIQDGAVVGKPPALSRHSTARRTPSQAAVLAEGAVICCNAIVFAGAHIGARTIIGDQAYVRERARIGDDVLIGRASAIDPEVVIGDRTRIQTGAYICTHSLVESDVFIGPGVISSNDDTMARHGAGHALRGCTVRRAARIGAGVVICPDIEIGEEAYVAAGAVVAQDVGPRMVVMGVPARPVREVGREDLLEEWR